MRREERKKMEDEPSGGKIKMPSERWLRENVRHAP